MLMHATLLQPYLSTQCIVSITFWTTALIFYIVQNQGDVIHYVASILELVVPLLVKYFYPGLKKILSSLQ